jgi:soluble lytic murein transglycosylase-like protein
VKYLLLSLYARLTTVGLLVAPALCVSEEPAAQAQQAAVSAQRQAAREAGAAIVQQRESVRRMRESVAIQRAAAARVRAMFTSGQIINPTDSMFEAIAPEPCQPMTAAELAPLVRDAGAREGISEALLRVVMKQESGYLPCAVSSRGALGLMQLMPSTAWQFGVQDPFDPKQNVDAGARYLKSLLNRYGGDLRLALGAYNAGPARVEAASGVPQIPETLDYIKDILSGLRGHSAVEDPEPNPSE